MQDVMMWLLLATGFMGGLTFVFVIRWMGRLFITQPSVTAHFAPKGGCTDAVVREIKAARREVLFLAAGCSSPPIAEALLKAKSRGLRVEVILDRYSEKDPSSDLPYLVGEGLVPRIDDKHRPARHQAIVIDGRTLLTGSFDFAEKTEADGAASLLVIRGHPELAKHFHERVEADRAQARPAAGESEKPAPPPPLRPAATEEKPVGRNALEALAARKELTPAGAGKKAG